MSGPVTYVMEGRDDEEEGWRGEGARELEAGGVRSGVDVTVRMRQWGICDVTPMPLSKLSLKPLKLISPPCLLLRLPAIAHEPTT